MNIQLISLPSVATAESFPLQYWLHWISISNSSFILSPRIYHFCDLCSFSPRIAFPQQNKTPMSSIWRYMFLFAHPSIVFGTMPTPIIDTIASTMLNPSPDHLSEQFHLNHPSNALNKPTAYLWVIANAILLISNALLIYYSSFKMGFATMEGDFDGNECERYHFVFSSSLEKYREKQ